MRRFASSLSSRTIGSRQVPSQNLARVHQVARIERGLERAHELDLDRGLVTLQLLALRLPDAVLGAEAAAEALHDIEHALVDVGRREGGWVRAIPFRDEAVVVQIAVAEMPEADDTRPGKSTLQRCAGFRDELRDAGDGKRDVVPVEDALRARRLRDRLPNAPQRIALRAARRDRGVENEPALGRARRRPLELVLQ